MLVTQISTSDALVAVVIGFVHAPDRMLALPCQTMWNASLIFFILFPENLHLLQKKKKRTHS